jgi:hypothetical protein
MIQTHIYYIYIYIYIYSHVRWVPVTEAWRILGSWVERQLLSVKGNYEYIE